MQILKSKFYQPRRILTANQNEPYAIKLAEDLAKYRRSSHAAGLLWLREVYADNTNPNALTNIRTLFSGYWQN